MPAGFSQQGYKALLGDDKKKKKRKTIKAASPTAEAKRGLESDKTLREKVEIIPAKDIAPGTIIPSKKYMDEYRAELKKAQEQESESTSNESSESSQEKSLYDKLAGQLKVHTGGLTADQKSQFNKALNRIEAEYEKDKDTIAKQRLAERLAGALTQLGAGLHGLKTGTDMSGLKFTETDWEKRLDRALQEFRGKRETIEREREAERGETLRQAQSRQAAQGQRLTAAALAQRADQAQKRLDLEGRRYKIAARRAATEEAQRRAQEQAKRIQKAQVSIAKILQDEDADDDYKTATKLKYAAGLPQSPEQIQEVLTSVDPWGWKGPDAHKAATILTADLILTEDAEQGVGEGDYSGLEDYAAKEFGGDVGAARKYLKSQGIDPDTI